MTLNKVTAAVRKVVLGLVITGGAMFQVGSCTVDSTFTGFEDLLGTAWSDYDYGYWGTEDPLGIDIDLPYFDEGDYFEVPSNPC